VQAGVQSGEKTTTRGSNALSCGEFRGESKKQRAACDPARRRAWRAQRQIGVVALWPLQPRNKNGPSGGNAKAAT
jgi:hypothetical protein